MGEAKLEREVKQKLQKKKFNKRRIQRLIKQLLIELHDDPNRPGLLDTPRRVADMYEEIFEGQLYTNEEIAKMFDVTFNQTQVKSNSLVIEKDITIFSMCEHHMITMYDMKCSIGYIPKDKIIGLSKLNRIAQMCSRRLQLQEKLCEDIADVVSKVIDTEDVAVYIEGKHGCVAMRGIKDPNSKTVSSCMKGAFRDNFSLRNEFLNSIR